jgi:hypothetical protein
MTVTHIVYYIPDGYLFVCEVIINLVLGSRITRIPRKFTPFTAINKISL